MVECTLTYCREVKEVLERRENGGQNLDQGGRRRSDVFRPLFGRIVHLSSFWQHPTSAAIPAEGCPFACVVFFVWVVKCLAMAMVGSNVPRLFQTFMARVIALEDMAKLSSQMLVVFQQELDMFRRSPLNNSSTLAQVLAKEPSERLKAYQEAGYRHCHTDHAVLVKLDNALKFLQNHVQRAREVIEELQKLLEEANGILHDDLNARLGNIALTEGVGSSETAQVGDLGQGVGIGQVSSPNIKVRQLLTSDYVTTMAAIFGMLQQDFIMQQRVVVTLGLDLSSELLQNYQMMWTLRPFVDESVVEEALTWTAPFTG